LTLTHVYVQKLSKATITRVILASPGLAGEARMMDGTTEKKMRTYPLMTRRQVEHLIAEGRSIIIINQHVLKVDAWLQYHPGGDKAIAHEVGRDATDEVTVFVSPP
jgi:cytochrome b involved in lipid metabolism